MKNLLSIKGIKLAACASGIKQANKQDLAIIELPPESHISAAFTQNTACAAPVEVARSHHSNTPSRLLVINSGNANAGTGKQGTDDTISYCKKASEVFSLKTEQVLPFSTGVIGELLPVERISDSFEQLKDNLHEDNWQNVAEAIMTTDTKPKGISKEITINGGESITITGIAKGAGMIQPNMATMLAFIATDIFINQDDLDKLLKTNINESFNCITVDGETSTNDACVLMSTSSSSHKFSVLNKQDKENFCCLLREVFIYLAKSIVRDGEGATKFITVEVQGAQSKEEAHTVAYSIANSPLVKTAFFAQDPNWGRILSAAGKTQYNMESLKIYVCDICVYDSLKPNTYNENDLKELMLKTDVIIRLDLGCGTNKVKIWTTDLSYDYIKINAEYRS
jgi:glutamate N-acetyltransferase/amino-acid N-acetyltransferase